MTTTSDNGAVDTNAANAAAAAAAAAATGNTDSQQNGTTTANGEGSTFDVTEALAGLEADNREWLSKQGYITDGKLDAAGVAKLGKQLHAQEKLLGNAIRIPGKDATPEERNAFLNKLGRPETADKYAFSVPKDMPEELPYDGEAAKAYAKEAHELGLSQEQASKLHDWFIQSQTATVKGFGEQQLAQKTEKAKAAVKTLEAEWGPIDGETAKANLQFADRVLAEAEPETLADLQAFGIIGPNKEIFSAPLAKLFAKVGAAIYREGSILKGDNTRVGNPFESDNQTEQMRIYKADPQHALSLIAAAGKKPADFGIPA